MILESEFQKPDQVCKESCPVVMVTEQGFLG
jgi:hypothetical protein